MKLLILLFSVFILSCNSSEPLNIKNDAEQIAFDKCNELVVNKRLENLNKKLVVIQDSLKITNLSVGDSKRLEFLRRQTINKLEYYGEQKKAYTNQDKEETAKYRKTKYAREEDWKKLNEKAEEILKTKGPCEPNAD
jgi:hypothetical protein